MLLRGCCTGARCSCCVQSAAATASRLKQFALFLSPGRYNRTRAHAWTALAIYSAGVEGNHNEKLEQIYRLLSLARTGRIYKLFGLYLWNWRKFFIVENVQQHQQQPSRMTGPVSCFWWIIPLVYYSFKLILYTFHLSGKLYHHRFDVTCRFTVRVATATR